MTGVTIAKDFVRDLVHGDFHAALERSTPEVQTLLTPEKLAKLWQNETEHLGEFVSTQSDSSRMLDGYENVELTILYSSGSLRVNVAVTKSTPPLVAGFHRLERRAPSA